MTELLINKMAVDLPADFSFDMEYENELFTKASEYSLDIELPLEGSPNNQKIFGNINRLTTPKENVNLEAVAYVNGRCASYGYAIIVSVTDTTITIQLVGNTSYFNYYSSDTYIDEMDLGYAQNPKPSLFTDGFHRYYHSADFNKLWGSMDDAEMVFFWSYYKDPSTIVDSTYFPQRYPNSPFPSFSSSSSDISSMWVNDIYSYSCQPYLLKVITHIINAMGFKIRRNDINHTWLRHLYICNYKGSKTADWLNDSMIGLKMTTALPHWKLSTFIDEYEKLCACIFLFNTYNKTVDIIQLDKYYGDTASIYTIPDDTILDEYEFEFSSDLEDKDIAEGNVSFNKDYTDKFLKMSEDVRDSIQTQKHFDNYEALLADYNKTDVSSRKKILYVDDKTGREYICYVDDSKKDSIKEVNLFSDLTRKKESDDSVQLNIVPANTKLYNIGWWFDQYQGAPSAGLSLNVPFSEQQQTNNPEYTTAQDIILNSYSDQTEAESSDCIEVMISTGQWYHLATYSNHSYNYPAPFSDFNMPCSAYGKFPEMSLSLKDVCENSLGHMYRNLPSYRSTHKFVIRFLDTKVPDVRQIFMIRNQRFVCRKISATFGQNTKDFILEGEFYRID